nr:Wzz/FepE/Etk N-terminal domain-containing protein [uncultured Blautia sp.]
MKNQETTNSQGNLAAAPLQEEGTIDLMELFWAAVSRWKLLLLALLTGALLAGIYHTYMLAPTYQADSSIFITSNESIVSISDLQISSELTADYAAIIKSRNVLKQVIKDLDLDLNYKQLANLVSVTNPTDSHIIQISVTCGDMELSRDIANALLNTGIERIYQVIGNSEPTVIDYSEAEAVMEVTPGFFKYVVMGALLGLIIACGLILVQFLTDTTIKTEDELSKQTGVPVLAVIPYYEEKK